MKPARDDSVGSLKFGFHSRLGCYDRAPKRPEAFGCQTLIQVAGNKSDVSRDWSRNHANGATTTLSG